MKLPKQISPNPLLTSTVEVRFSSKLTDNDLLGLFFPVFSKDFPKLKERGIPKEMKQVTPGLEYATDYIFSNDEYSFSIAKNVVAFENIGTYHLWDKYFPVIKENLKKLNDMKVVNSILRIGVRYASMFDGQQNQAAKILKQGIGMQFPGYDEKLQTYQSNLTRNNTSFLVQIMPDAHSQLPGGTLRKGFYIDIDASCTGKGELKIGSQLFEKIEELHLEEKTLFFSLLKEDFIKTLNPIY